MHTLLLTRCMFRYQKAWPKALPLLGRLFLHLRSASYPILTSTLKVSATATQSNTAVTILVLLTTDTLVALYYCY
jgi:hypothetical protein